MTLVVKTAYYTAIFGLGANVIVHGMILLGANFQRNFPAACLLILPLFFIWLALLLPAKQFARQSRWDPLQFAPAWMKALSKFFLFYMVINFAFFFYVSLTRWGGGFPKESNGKLVLVRHEIILRELSREEYDQCVADFLRAFSGHLLVFYAFGMAGLSSRLRSADRGE